MINKKLFAQDVLKEFIRVNKLKEKAFYSGKNSKAIVNVSKVAKKYNLSSSNGSFSEMVFANVLMKTMFAGYTTNEDILLPIIEKVIETNEQLLSKELNSIV